MQIEEISRIAQNCFESNPTIILGSGASMPYGLPSMKDLEIFLKSNLETHTDAEEDAWVLIKTALSNGDHLEAALENVQMPKSLLERIIFLTWRCVLQKDSILLEHSISDPNYFCLGKLLTKLLSSTINEVNIVTTNYDRVIEYTCNSSGILFQAGFSPGYIQKWESSNKPRFAYGHKSAKVVKIWKVHGSLDWFKTPDDQILGLPIFHASTNPKFEPLIVTPGLNKYERTYEDPFRTTINGADDSLKNASAFLCVGFGFRDKHIHPKIVERCRQKNVPTVILARTLTNEAKAFLERSAGKNFIAIEKKDNGSRVYSSDYPNGIAVNEPDIWSLDGFTVQTQS